MAKRPEDRFQSAAEVSEVLSDALIWSQQPHGRTAPYTPAVRAPKRRWRHRMLGYACCLAIVLFVAWATLFPSFGLLVSNKAQIKFDRKDGDSVVELYRDGQLVATQVGFGKVRVPTGTYAFRVREKPGLRLYHFLFEQRTWWFHRDQVTLMSAPQALLLHSGDQLTVWLSFVEVARQPEAPDGDGGTASNNALPAAAVPFSAQQARAYQEQCAERVGVPVERTDAAGIIFHLIPPGVFEMGNLPGQVNEVLRELDHNGASEFDKFAARSGAPRHTVQLTQPFYMSTSEITVAQFRQFVDETGYRSTLETVKSPPFTWQALAEGSDAQCMPVNGVSWEDAAAFCRWLSKRQQGTYELPTEAQWEYACRAGSAQLWSFGDERHLLDQYAVCGESPATAPAPIRSKQPNAFGLFDMYGNVDEWCLDWHRSDFYGRSPAADPVCVEEATDPASGRVCRGGSWNAAAWATQSASRSYDFPGLPVRAHGFRVVIIGDLQTAVGHSH